MSGGGADEAEGTWSRLYRRPYTVTGGRTRPAHDDLELETLVQTVTGIDEQLAGLGREQRSIAALCREAVSVAEISGRLDLLLGVTRVIVGATRPEQVHANAKASGIQLTPDTLAAIDEALGDTPVREPTLAPNAHPGVAHR